MTNDAAFTLVAQGISPTQAAKKLGLGRSTLYHKIAQNRPELMGARAVSLN